MYCKVLYTPFGEAKSAKIIKDYYSNRSKGFGFVEMTDNNSEQQALNELNGTTSQDRQINVNKVRPQKRRSAGKSSRH